MLKFMLKTIKIIVHSNFQYIFVQQIKIKVKQY